MCVKQRAQQQCSLEKTRGGVGQGSPQLVIALGGTSLPHHTFGAHAYVHTQTPMLFALAVRRSDDADVVIPHTGALVRPSPKRFAAHLRYKAAAQLSGALDFGCLLLWSNGTAMDARVSLHAGWHAAMLLPKLMHLPKLQQSICQNQCISCTCWSLCWTSMQDKQQSPCASKRVIPRRQMLSLAVPTGACSNCVGHSWGGSGRAAPSHSPPAINVG